MREASKRDTLPSKLLLKVVPRMLPLLISKPLPNRAKPRKRLPSRAKPRKKLLNKAKPRKKRLRNKPRVMSLRNQRNDTSICVLLPIHI